MNNSEILAAAQKAADTAQAAAKEAGDKLAEIKESMAAKDWPQIGDEVWTIFCEGDLIAGRMREGNPALSARLDQGNVLPSKAEALAERDRRAATTKVLARIKGLNAEAGWVCDWSDFSQLKCQLGYDHVQGCIAVNFCWHTQSEPTSHFFCVEAGGVLLKELPPEILLMLGVNSEPSKHSPTD